jgi:hypothetical protein
VKVLPRLILLAVVLLLTVWAEPRQVVPLVEMTAPVFAVLRTLAVNRMFQRVLGSLLLLSMVVAVVVMAATGFRSRGWLLALQQLLLGLARVRRREHQAQALATAQGPEPVRKERRRRRRWREKGPTPLALPPALTRARFLAAVGPTMVLLLLLMMVLVAATAALVVAVVVVLVVVVANSYHHHHHTQHWNQ